MATLEQKYRETIASIIQKDDEMRNIMVYLDNCLKMPSDEVCSILTGLNELKKGMQKDVMHFEFKKKDGTRRSAYGTRAQDVLTRNDSIPQSDSKRQGRTGSVFPYYDIEKSAWRGFKVESLIRIDRDYTI